METDKAGKNGHNSAIVFVSIPTGRLLKFMDALWSMWKAAQMLVYLSLL